jgi:hypothetical protein
MFVTIICNEYFEVYILKAVPVCMSSGTEWYVALTTFKSGEDVPSILRLGVCYITIMATFLISNQQNCCVALKH